MFLGHKTGLGKTFISLHALTRMEPKRIIITGNNPSLSVWMKEVPKWTEGQVTYLSRKDLRLQEKWAKACDRTVPGIWLINHAMFQLLVGKTPKKQLIWDAAIEDEAHKSKNRKTLLYAAMKKISTEACLQLSATPVSRGAQDMWAHLNVQDPKKFSSYWRFVNRYCWVTNDGYGTQVEGTRHAAELKELLKDYYITRNWEDVHEQMPPLRRFVHDLEMDPEQERLYRKMATEMMLCEDDTFVITSGILAQQQRLRQLALCPRVLGNELPLGSGIEYLLDEIPPNDCHVAVLSTFREVLEVLKRELESRSIPVNFLHGGMNPEEVLQEINSFEQRKGVMLCTISFAQSFSLASAHRAYVLGADPDPINNIQAEGRFRRADTKMFDGMLVKYIIMQGTKEEDFRDIINRKVATVRDFLPDYGR